MGMQRYKAYTYLDNFILNLGFSLTKISITGIHKIDEYEIKEHIKYKKCRNLFCIDLEATKYALEQLDWVKNANLKLWQIYDDSTYIVGNLYVPKFRKYFSYI